MSKLTSLDLFELVKSLTKSEKRYFKLFSSWHVLGDGNSYVKLFDALTRQKTYDEGTLKRSLQVPRLDLLKNHLYKSILQSLSDFHSNSSVNAQIQNLIFQSEILYKRGLKKAADKILHKAEYLALEHEKHEYLLIASSIKANNALEFVDMEEMNNFVESGIKKEKKSYEVFKNTSDYRNLAIKIGVLDQSPEVVSTNATLKQKLKQLFGDQLLKKSNSAYTASAKKHFYNLHYKRFLSENKWNEESCSILKEWVDYLEKKPNTRNNLPELYLKALGRLLGAYNFTGKQFEAEITYSRGLNFYKSLPKKSVSKSIQQAFASVTTNYMGGQLYFFKPENCILAFNDMNHPAFPGVANKELNIVGYINLSFSYFFLEKYREALSCLNKILSIKSDFRTDVQALARTLSLIVHFEMKNNESLPYLSKSVERWLEKHNYQPKHFDKVLIDFFKNKAYKITNSKEEKKEFALLFSQFKKMNVTEYSILKKEVDPALWVESKIQNRKMLEMMKVKSSRIQE